MKLEDLTAGRFVILRHDHPVLHWDLLLEHLTSAATWRLESLPRENSVISAERIADHRLLYLDYEGPVSGNRGHVTRVFRGRFSVVRDPEVSTHAQSLLTITLCPMHAAAEECIAGSMNAKLQQNAAGTTWSFEAAE